MVGLSRSGLAGQVMDENSRRESHDATGVMRHAMVASSLESAAKAEELGLAGEKNHPLVQSFKRSGFDCHLS